MRWADKAAFVGVANGGDEASFERFIDDHGLTFPQISDASGLIFAILCPDSARRRGG